MLLNAGTTGTPASTPRPPAISKANLSDLIKVALKQSHPTVTVVLNRRVALDGSIPYEVLENDGILAPAKVAAPSCESGPAYILTERGKQTSVSRGWQIYTSLMVIPVGPIQYVPNSAAVDPMPNPLFKGRRDTYDLTFRYRFLGNSNALYLLSLAPAFRWTVSLLNLPDVHLGSGRMRVLLSRWRGVWSLSKIPYFRAPRCGTP